MRSAREALEIRLDMLGHAATPDYDLYLALDFSQGAGVTYRSTPRPTWIGICCWLFRPPARCRRWTARCSRYQVQACEWSRPDLRPGHDQREPGCPARSKSGIAGLGVTPPARRNRLTADPSYAGEPAPPRRGCCWPSGRLTRRTLRQPPYGAGTAHIPARWAAATGCCHLLRAARAEQAPLALLDLKTRWRSRRWISLEAWDWHSRRRSRAC